MADFTAPSIDSLTDTPSSALITTTLLIYALFGIGAATALVSSGFPLAWPLTGIFGIVAVILAYVKRHDAAGTRPATRQDRPTRTGRASDRARISRQPIQRQFAGMRDAEISGAQIVALGQPVRDSNGLHASGLRRRDARTGILDRN